MGFAVALGLAGLIKPLPLGALLRVLLVHRLTGERFNDREHAAVAEVTVVSDGEHAAAGLLLVGCHPLPEVPWVIAAHRRLRRKRYDLARPLTVVAEDDVAVQIVPTRVRSPLVADESGEATWLVKLLRRRDVVLPCSLIGATIGAIHEVLRERPLGESRDDFDRRLCALSRLDHVVPLAAHRVGQE